MALTTATSNALVTKEVQAKGSMWGTLASYIRRTGQDCRCDPNSDKRTDTKLCALPERGVIQLSTLRELVAGCCGITGWPGAIGFSSCAWSYVAYAASGLYLATWVAQTEDESTSDADTLRSALTYAALCLLHMLGLLIEGTGVSVGAVRAGRSLHNECAQRVLSAPVTWFDQTPSGRIVSRFASDCSAVDIQLSISSEVWGLHPLPPTARLPPHGMRFSKLLLCHCSSFATSFLLCSVRRFWTSQNRGYR
eukprot:5649431-Amphidinium_carterae.1